MRRMKSLKITRFLDSALADNKRTIRKFGVKRIGLFGSAVRGELKIGSDRDILVEF
ncbi:MAG: nucleotidyltransferase domain-containing protein, partial [Methanophagales archaeon]|nr:nucleotidyltransferase domain-containing protein [Methanophagales archaeon]